MTENNNELKPTLLDSVKAITDVCLLVEDVERTVDFYTNKLGFEIRFRANGFVDFKGPGVTLAAWELDHINHHTGVSNARAAKGVNKACIAVEISSIEKLDALYHELIERGVEFLAPPKKYPAWQAYCAYFHDPDDTLWEIYHWYGEREYSHRIFAEREQS